MESAFRRTALPVERSPASLTKVLRQGGAACLQVSRRKRRKRQCRRFPVNLSHAHARLTQIFWLRPTMR